LGEFPDRYSLEEKLSIVQAYKKGGGVQGLADIIEDDDDEEQNNQGIAQNMNGELDDEEEELDIDLDNPNDVKLIDQEF